MKDATVKPLQITDTTEKRWPEMSKGTAEQNEKQKVLWFDTNGMGPSVHDWTVRAFLYDETDAEQKEVKESGVGIEPNIGIEFSRVGGPCMDLSTAKRLHAALGAAIDIATRQQLDSEPFWWFSTYEHIWETRRDVIVKLTDGQELRAFVQRDIDPATGLLGVLGTRLVRVDNGAGVDLTMFSAWRNA